MVTEAYDQRLDLDHAVAMVRERTDQRYKALAPTPTLGSRRKSMSSAATRNNVAGIMHALEKDSPGN